MIERIWHGYTTPEDADEYEQLLREEIFPSFDERDIEGYHGFRVLRRERDDEVEFVTIMRFDSLAGVKEFVGEEYEQANLPDAALTVLSDWDETAAHYEVRFEGSGSA